ncbi:Peptidase A22B, signal peptide peptidase [Parasponia andersonii]|uniref:Peptidase A22B, signal peptide peptidase n=1 Tax=Parasponia andersonii TaxID=3476 RepID=A0A2P5D0S2_PARAD|nr:Peptidase A22B, signal peptide peptidase [Parasponia andersonii]
MGIEDKARDFCEARGQMAFHFQSLLLRIFLLFSLFALSFAGGSDVTLDDDSSPKSPPCNNPFNLVKVKEWIDGDEDESLVGVNARFGALLPSHADKDLKLPVVFSDPLNGCSSSSLKLSGYIAMSIRGDCDFTTKAEAAQAGGAAALLVINDKEDLYKMVCSENDTALNISIPVVMIPKSGGEALNKSLASGKRVELLLYSPKRPIVDFSVVFLWMMAVGTLVCASLWSEFTAPERTDERYNELSPKESGTAKDDSEKEILDISAKGAVVFVIVASTFLVLLYFFMSSWFIWVLIVLFCIGGIEGMHNCIVGLILSKCRNCGKKSVDLPLFGEVSVLSLVVLFFCAAFAIFWAANRRASYSWVGQDILVSFIYDKANKKGVASGYFLWLVVGYGFGLFFTYLGLYLMDGHGQPALLYLVPCTLGVIVVLGLIRGELKHLWNYGTESSPSTLSNSVEP